MPREAYFTVENLAGETDRMLNEIRNTCPNARDFTGKSGKAALIVTDFQNYFTLRGSRAFVPSSEAIRPNIRMMVNTFITAGLPVIFTQHYDRPGSESMMGRWWRNRLERDSVDFNLHEEMPGPGSSLIIEKCEYDAFQGTELDGKLDALKVDSLIISGVMTNLCCETTARSAFVKGYHVCIPVDATAAYTREFHMATFLNLAFGFMPLSTTQLIIRSIETRQT